jgi:hypothetical protein
MSFLGRRKYGIGDMVKKATVNKDLHGSEQFMKQRMAFTTQETG